MQCLRRLHVCSSLLNLMFESELRESETRQGCLQKARRTQTHACFTVVTGSNEVNGGASSQEFRRGSAIETAYRKGLMQRQGDIIVSDHISCYVEQLWYFLKWKLSDEMTKSIRAGMVERRKMPIYAIWLLAGQDWILKRSFRPWNLGNHYFFSLSIAIKSVPGSVEQGFRKLPASEEVKTKHEKSRGSRFLVASGTYSLKPGSIAVCFWRDESRKHG